MSNPAGGHAVNPFVMVRPEWLALHREEIIDPDLPIIDAHHHLWDRPGWRYLLDELLEDFNSGHNIVASVYVQAWAMYRARGEAWMRPVGETEFVNGAAAMSASGSYSKTRAIAAIVGYADLRDAAHVDAVLEAHARTAGARFRGIRQITAWDDEPSLNNPEAEARPGMLRDPALRRGVAALAKAGLTFDAWIYHTQLHDLAELAQAAPETPMVLNHFGGPLGIGPYEGRGDEVFKNWSAGIRALAQCPNVSLKLGGLGLRVVGQNLSKLPKPPSSEHLANLWRPYVETSIEAFGARRCMFESNFPVDKASYSYAVGWNAFKRLAAGASAEERKYLFSETARRFYRLDEDLV
ncbi:MAG TPA: amidohydrolase family protein [Burkholderiales bacterium]